MKKTWLNGYMYEFSINYNTTDVSDVHKYWMKKQYERMFWWIKQVFIVLVTFSGSLAAKSMFLNGEPYLARPTVIDLNPNELHYYPFMISLDRFSGSCNTVKFH